MVFSQLGAALTAAFGVSEKDFTNLAPLIISRHPMHNKLHPPGIHPPPHGILPHQLGAALTAAFGVSEKDFTNLAPLILVCNLSSLLPLLAIGWLDAAEEQPLLAGDVDAAIDVSHDTLP